MQSELSFSPMYTKALDAKSRSVEAVISSETVDGHGEIIDQLSWRLERYRQNPVVLYQHSPYSVVGRAENVRLVDGNLHARIVFATTAQADEVFTLFRDGAMRAFSVGFRAGRIEKAVVGGREIRRLLDCELFEVSAVSIPSNPDAVVKHKSLGLLPAAYELDPSGVLVRAALDEVDGKRSPLTPTGDASADFIAEAMRGFGPGGGTDPFDGPGEAA
jgi:HK97 family phage prohead protease